MSNEYNGDKIVLSRSGYLSDRALPFGYDVYCRFVEYERLF